MNLSIPLLDARFDAHLPPYVRARSREFWTPVAVIARVTAAFLKQGARKVLDVGCGPGKFCIVAALMRPELELHGIEQRPRLVAVGTDLAERFRVPNVHLYAGNVFEAPWDDYDGFYFFNPFAENVFNERDHFDELTQLSTTRFRSELSQVEARLARAPAGTVVVTYHGLGGPIPASYDLVADEPAGTNRIRTWVQRSQRQARWVWLEQGTSVMRVFRTDTERAPKAHGP